MSGDIKLMEQLLVTDAQHETSNGEQQLTEGRVLHKYGDRVRIVEGPEITGPERTRAILSIDATKRAQFTQTEALGAAAFALRESPKYVEAKRNRPRQGEPWNLPEGGCMATGRLAQRALAAEALAAPTSSYMEGETAVGIVIVSGPTAALQFSEAERVKVVAEVQNGLSYYASTYPSAGISFVYDIKTPQINVQPDANASDLEGLWRIPALKAIGFNDAQQYINQLRTNFGTRWTYCGFFTKYPLSWFAYAFVGGPYLVMQYANDGWGPDNIDRVFTHETGHIFNCPDEYASSGCTCGGSFGRWGKPNSNCQNCAPNGGIACIMKGNDWSMCTVTPAHLGWVPARLFAKNSRKSMDVGGASTVNGAAIIQWAYHGGENQLFRPDPLGDGYVRLVAQHSGKVLEVAGSSKDNGAQLVQWDWNGGDNQRFKLETLEEGYLRIIAKHSGKVIDVSGGSTSDGSPLIQWEWHGGDNQRWLATAPITAENSGKVMDVSGGSTANGASVIQWAYHGKGNQIFRPEPLGDGYFRFVAQHSGKVLDVAGASMQNGANLIQHDWHGGDNQRFRLKPLGDGHMKIVAKHSGKVVDVSGASTGDGAQLIQHDWHGGDNQRFIVPVWQDVSAIAPAVRLCAKNSGKAMDIAGGSNANGAKLIQWAYHGGANQLFRPDPLGDGYFRLVAQHSGKVLDVGGASLQNGAPLIQWTWHGGDNQRFKLEMLADGSMRVIAKHSGKVIDVSGGSTADAAQLIQWDWHGGDNQRWLPRSPLSAEHSGKVLDVSGGSTANGAAIIQWPYHGGANQIFRLERLADGYYRFVVQHSGKVLDVSGGSMQNGAQLIQWDWHGGDNQRFRLEQLQDGRVRITAKHSGKVLDISGGTTANGASLIQYDWHGGDNQRWMLPLSQVLTGAVSAALVLEAAAKAA